MSLKDRLFAEKARYLTASVLIALLCLILWLDWLYLFWAVLGIFLLIALSEMLILLDCRKHLAFFSCAGAAWLLALFCSDALSSGLLFMMISASLLAYKKSFSPRYLIALLYPMMPFLALFDVYKNFGANAIIWLVVLIAVCDTGAYFGGRIFGRTPFCPTSPNKTMEGAVIGITLAVCVGSLLGVGIVPSMNFFSSIVVSFLVALSGIFGDLFESYLKREAGVKDSGRLLPGHGGVLDRFDAALFGAVMMLFLLYVISSGKEVAHIPF